MNKSKPILAYIYLHFLKNLQIINGQASKGAKPKFPSPYNATPKVRNNIPTITTIIFNINELYKYGVIGEEINKY